MPSNLLAADVLFPHLTEKQSTDEKFAVVTDYLYMLLEQLRYTLANLGEGNFNQAELENIGNVITQPVYVQLQGLEGQMASLSVTAEGIATRVSGVEGNISTLTQTANGLNTRVTNAEGNISTLTQTASGLDSRVTNAVGAISAVSVTANKINWLVKSGTSASDFEMTDRAINLVAAKINLTGYVTFASLADSSSVTTINGGALTTCDIKASTITGSTLNAVLDTYGYINGDLRLYYSEVWDGFLAGGVKLDLGGAGSSTEARARMIIYTRSLIGEAVALKLQAYGGVSVESQTANAYIGAATVAEIQAPSIYLWGNVYVNGNLIS